VHRIFGFVAEAHVDACIARRVAFRDEHRVFGRIAHGCRCDRLSVGR
jgi:hypothetical protein